MKISLLSKFILIACFSVLLFGCKANLADGKVPTQYLSQAQAYTGTYSGTVSIPDARGAENDVHMELILEIESDGTAVLKAHNANGENELIPNCESTIGQLVSANVDADKKMIQGVSFAFATGNCLGNMGQPFEGTTVDLAFKSSDELSVSVYDKTITRHQDPYVTSVRGTLTK